MDLAAVTVATFEPLVGDTFTIPATPQDLELVLESATVVAQRPDTRDSFSLVLRGPREPLLPQSIYRFRHSELGTLGIFIVPIAQDDAGTSYEANFT